MKYEVLASSDVFDGALKATAPAPTVDGTVRPASFWSGAPALVADHSSARRFAGVPTAAAKSISRLASV